MNATPQPIADIAQTDVERALERVREARGAALLMRRLAEKQARRPALRVSAGRN